MGTDDRALSVCAHYARDGVYVDDGSDGLHPLVGASVLAHQRDYARQLSVGVHPYRGLCRQHDFVQRPVLLDDHSVRVLAGVAGHKDRSAGHDGRGASGMVPAIRRQTMSSESDQVMRGELAKPPVLRGGGLLTIPEGDLTAPERDWESDSFFMR